jgi:hypothetical protein
MGSGFANLVWLVGDKQNSHVPLVGKAYHPILHLIVLL